MLVVDAPDPDALPTTGLVRSAKGGSRSKTLVPEIRSICIISPINVGRAEIRPLAVLFQKGGLSEPRPLLGSRFICGVSGDTVTDLRINVHAAFLELDIRPRSPCREMCSSMY